MPKSNGPLTSCDIDQIARELIQPIGVDDQNDTPVAAVTYLAQMIAHDIVPATNKKHLDRAKHEISPYLNLDSIYGTSRSCLRRRKIINYKGRFNYRVNSNIPWPHGFDFDRNEDLDREEGVRDVANTPEQRNDENIIVSQFTVLWMRLHNMLLDRGYANSFKQAQEYVIKTFQLVCIEYVLANVSDKEVFNHYFRNVNPVPFTIKLTDGLPKYFSHASFRFGHSMVRNEYFFNGGKPNTRFHAIDVPDIFQKHKKIKNNQHVKFELFFTPSSGQMLAQNIDSKVVFGMAFIGQQFTDNNHLVNIVKRNLEASKKGGLKSGQGVHRFLIKSYGSSAVGKLLSHKELLNTQIPSRFFKKLPLWLYLLAEAEVRGNGVALGKVGSILNIEVLGASIAQCPTSVYIKNSYNFNQTLNAMGSWGKQLLLKNRQTGNIRQHLMSNIYNLTI